MRTLSPATMQAGNAQETGEVYLVLLKISHEGLAEAIRVVNNNVAITSNGETYLPYAFRYDPPDDTATGMENGMLTIDNVDRSFIAVIRAIDSPPTVEVSVILASDPDNIQVGPLEFSFSGVTYNAKSISGALVYDDMLSYEFPQGKFRPMDFPGLF